MGWFSPTLQTCIMPSVEHVAKETLSRQSTSRVGAEKYFCLDQQLTEVKI
jgi:hypothetical protein